MSALCDSVDRPIQAQLAAAIGQKLPRDGRISLNVRRAKPATLLGFSGTRDGKWEALQHAIRLMEGTAPPSTRGSRNHISELSVSHEIETNILYTTPMATLEDVARFLGLSKTAVRNRVNALGETLDAYLSRGERNRLIFEGEAVAILRRLEELRESEGLPIRAAAERLKWELSYMEQPPGVYIMLPTDIESSVIRDVVQELFDERDHWRSYAKMLQSVLPTSLKWLTHISPSGPSDRRLN